jgi:cellobiose-specific phosphotransferase system component IIB
MLKCFNQANNFLLSDIKDNRDNKDKDIIKSSFSNLNIPLDPQEFYKDFGLLLHPKTGEFVSNLTNYQYQIWKDKYNSKYRLVLKSQKVGLSTSILLENFQDSITRYKGKDILIIAQTTSHANEHLRTLKNLILNSEKYRQFLITNPSELLLKEEKSKVSVAYIKNPDNPLRPSRIIALGASEGSVWSWKNVSKIHMSDIAATSLVDDSGLFAAAFSRLANTDGSLIIETPPRGARGRVYEIFEQIQKGESEFSLHIVKADQAVQAGLISADFLIAERQRLGPLYPQYYAAEFIEGIGNIFSIEAIDRAVELGKQYNIVEEINPNSEKYMCLDPGYSSSKFAILIAEWNRNDKKIIILYANEFDKLNYEEAIDIVFRLIKQYGRVVNVGIDMSSLELIMSLKKKIGERSDWNYITNKLQYCTKHNLDPAQYMTIVPVPFTVSNKAYMISHCRRLLEDSRSLVAINPIFNNLIIGLKSSVVDNRGLLDKQETISDDLVDTFQIMSSFFKFKSSGDY